MCLAEFATTFVTNYTPEDKGDVLPPPKSETMSSWITLTGDFGMMSWHRKEAVIRFHRYNKNAEATNWYHAKLMLYFPGMMKTGSYCVSMQPMKNIRIVYILLFLPVRAGTVKPMLMT